MAVHARSVGAKRDSPGTRQRFVAAVAQLDNGTPVISVTGDVDLATAPELLRVASLRHAVAPGTNQTDILVGTAVRAEAAGRADRPWRRDSTLRFRLWRNVYSDVCYN